MKTIGIYPGNFQPAHRGHVHVYKKLRQVVGGEVFVITTDRTPIPDAPLNFGEKENIWVRHGVPASHIVKVEDWKNPHEVFSRISPSHTNVVFALTEKEAEEVSKNKGHSTSVGKDSNQPVDASMPDVSYNQEEEPETSHSKEVWLDADGNPGYFQPFKSNQHNMETLDHHAYVMVIDDNIIEGKPISTAHIREGLGSERYTEETKQKFFKWAFGWFDIGLFQLLQDKFKMAHKTARDSIGAPTLDIPVSEGYDQALNNLISEMVEEFLTELSTPGGDISIEDFMTDTAPGEEQRQKDASNKRQAASRQKAAAERELKSLQADTKWKEADLKRKKSDELPNKRKEIDDLNKTISTI